MKLHADPLTSLNTVTAYGPDFIEINKQRHTGNVLVAPEHPVTAWSAPAFEQLSAEHFDEIAALQPELVILGTGTRQRFPHPRLTRKLTERQIGVEAMDTQAACRTYNILMTEGRKVVAAFLQDHSV